MSLARHPRSHDSQAGIALLAVLWVITLLGLVAMALSNSVQNEVRTATYQKEAAQAHALACGGVEAAILAIAYPPPDETEQPPFWTWQLGQREGVVPFPGGRARLQIVNESGKLDLNTANREQLVGLFEARGLGPIPAERLASAILHWRAPDNPDDSDTKALNEYYESVGIHPRHDRIESVEEVLNVRGMSREIFYGTVEVSEEGKVRQEYGVGQDLTVASRGSQVNVNYASEYALQSAPGMTADLAQAIVEGRRDQPFRSLTDIGDRLAIFLPDESLPWLTTGESKIYSIISEGEITRSRVRRTVRAVVQVGMQGLPRHRVLAWYDDYVSD